MAYPALYAAFLALDAEVRGMEASATKTALQGHVELLLTRLHSVGINELPDIVRRTRAGVQ